MGIIFTNMFQRQRDEELVLPGRYGAGSHQDTDLEVSITMSDSDFLGAVEIEPRNSGTLNTDQVEAKGERRVTGKALVQKGAPHAQKRGTKRGVSTTEPYARKKRSKNWTHAETQTLIESRFQPSLEKGKLEWEAISDQIPGRAGTQCQQRWDTVLRTYKKIKRHCDTHGKVFSQVTEEEFQSMKVGNVSRSNNWYNMIDEYYRSRASSEAATEGPADVDTTEPPASTSAAVQDADVSEDPDVIFGHDADFANFTYFADFAE